jgi:hypothetical protein
MSEHKFNRLCAPCSIYAAEISNDGCVGIGYTSNLAAIGSRHVGGFMTPFQILAYAQKRAAELETACEAFSRERPK